MSNQVEVSLGRIMFDEQGDEAMMFKVNVPHEMMKKVTGAEERNQLCLEIMKGLDQAIDKYMEFVNQLRVDNRLEPVQLQYPWRPPK